jgi:disulfide bond formation protein DsbB
MDDVEVANKLFLTLTIASLVVVGFALLLLVTSLVSRRVRGARDRVIARVGPLGVPLAAGVAVVTMLGSLYYSEVAGFVPCELCWYQRICMYGLAAVLVVGAVTRTRTVFWFAAPFATVGPLVALYHWLVERVPALADTTSCSALVPCSVPYFEEIGFVTLAFMDLTAFGLIIVLLVSAWSSGRSRLEEVAVR